MEKIQGWVEQGNTVLSITGAAGTITRKVQGSYPSATVTVSLTNPIIAAISTISRSSNTVTVTLAAPAIFAVGIAVVVSGVADSSFNGTFRLLTGGPSAFTYSQSGANASSSGGTVKYQLAAIYSDDSGTSKANPFTASVDGTWFFYVADGRYDVQFSGAGIASPFTIGDISAFDGPVALQAALPWINVKQAPYLAQGDGVVDDYASIIAAYNALPSGGTLLFPGQSTYNISQPWTLTRGSVRIVAVDPTAVLQYTGGATTYVVGDNGTSSTLYYNNEISNLTIRGNASVQYGLQVTSQHHSKFLNLRIQNVASTGMFVKFAVGNQYDVRVSNNDCPGGVYTVQPVCGVDFAGLDVSHAATASDCYLVVEGVSGSGIRMGFTDFMTLKGFSESNNRGLETYQQTENMSALNMDFESNATEDILLNPCYYSQFVGINAPGNVHLASGRGVTLLGGVYNNITIDANARNPMLTGQLVYIGTLTNNNPDETVLSPIINFNPGLNTFTPFDRFFGDSVDLLNRQGSPTLLRVRESAAQSGNADIQVTDVTTNTVYTRIGQAITVGQFSSGYVQLQPGIDAAHQGSIEFLINGIRYGFIGQGTAGNVVLTLEHGAKFAINNSGVFSRNLFSLTTWNPGTIVNNGAAFTTISVPGAVLGDTVLVSLQEDLQGLTPWAYVSSSDTVTVLLKNLTGGDITLGSTTVTLDIWQH